MTDLQSRIETAKEKLSSLYPKLEALQKSSKENSVASKSKDTTLAKVRTPPAVRVRRTLKGHFGKVAALHWGSDSSTLVSCGQDGNLLIWNTVTGNKIQAIPLKLSYVMAVGLEQNKMNLLACGGLDNLCTIYNRTNSAVQTELASHDGFITCCRFFSESAVVTSSGDSTCIYWDVSKGLPVNTFAEHTLDAMFLSIQPSSNNVFVSCSLDKTVKVWDTRESKSVQSFAGHHQSDINSVEFLPNARAFATCGQDNTVRIFDLRAYKEVNRFAVATTAGSTASNNNKDTPVEMEGFTSVAVSSSGRLIFGGHANGSVYAFDVLSEKGSPVFTLKDAHERKVSCVGVNPQGSALCTGSWDTILKIWA